MPIYLQPRSDDGRFNFLDRSATTAASDRAATPARRYVTDETLALITAFLPGFKTANDAINSALAGRVRETAEREAARVELDTHLRDGWEVLKRRAHRRHQSAEVLTYYGLPLDGAIPQMDTFDQLLGLAQGFVDGDVQAVAAGFPAMQNPSAAEVAAVLADARVQAADVPVADRRYDDAQAAVAALRPRADELIAEVMADLRYTLRKMDEPSQRRVMRSYGATFKSLPGEPVEESGATTDALGTVPASPVPENSNATPTGTANPAGATPQHHVSPMVHLDPAN